MEWLALIIGLLLIAATVGVILWGRTKQVKRAGPAASDAKAAPEGKKAAPRGRLTSSLSRTSAPLLSRLGRCFVSDSLSPKQWEEFEEALLEADVGTTTAMVLLEQVKLRLKENRAQPTAKQALREVCADILLANENKHELAAAKPLVISIVGVNGVGKTTSIGKIAHHFSTQGKSVLLGAADTFRAAAISQLKIWSERTHAQFVCGREGSDPGAVAFDSITAGKSRGVDVVLIDTAGRLHTKTNLMEELKKVHRVMKKVIPEAPHETWLVIDATIGQNSLHQAREFQSALDLTGVVISKLDGTAKGGVLLAIANELKLPMVYIGMGEKAEDLEPFDSLRFVDALLGEG